MTQKNTKQKVNISATLDREVVDFLDRLAVQEGVSRSLVINKLLQGAQRSREQLPENRRRGIALLGELSVAR